MVSIFAAPGSPNAYDDWDIEGQIVILNMLQGAQALGSPVSPSEDPYETYERMLDAGIVDLPITQAEGPQPSGGNPAYVARLAYNYPLCDGLLAQIVVAFPNPEWPRDKAMVFVIGGVCEEDLLSNADGLQGALDSLRFAE